MEVTTASTYCSSIIEVVRAFVRKRTSSCEILYNFHEGVFGANFKFSGQLIESIVNSIEKFSVDSLESNDNEFQTIATMLRKTFLKITIKIKCKDNRYYKYEMTESLFEKTEIDKPNMTDDSDLSITLITGLQLVGTDECLKNIESSLLLEASVCYKCSYQLIDLNTGKITLNINRCNDLREQISRIKQIKYHNIYHKVKEDSDYSLEICLYVNSILEEDIDCNQIVLLNFDRNSELEEHLASNLLPSIKGINFFAIYKNQTGDIKLIKQENFQLCVEILDFVQKNRDLALRKDSVEWLKDCSIELLEDHSMDTILRSSRRPKKFLHNEKVDLTVDGCVKEIKEEDHKESDYFLEITGTNENVFYEFTCSEHGNLVMSSPEPIEKHENTEAFNNWIIQCSPLNKPDIEDTLLSNIDEYLNSNYSPVISSSTRSNIPAVIESKPKSLITQLEENYNILKVQRQQQKSSENFSDLEIVDIKPEDNSNVKVPSIKSELMNGKIKSKLFSSSELENYGNRMNKPCNSNYKIPKVKYDLEKQAKAFDYFKNNMNEFNKKLNETTPDVIYTGTSKSSNGETKENFVSSLCKSLREVDVPGLEDELDCNFMTHREKSFRDSNTKRLNSARSLLREHKETYGNCSKEDDFEWTGGSPVSSIKITEKPKIENSIAKSPLVKAKDMLLSIFKSRKSEPSSISKPKADPDVSFVNSRSLPLDVEIENDSKLEPYKFFKTKNNNSILPVFVKKTDDDVIEVNDISDSESSSDTSHRSREIHRREEKRDRDRKLLRLQNTVTSRRRSRSNTRSRSRSPRRDRNRDRKRKSYYTDRSRKYKRSRSRSPHYLK